MTSHSNNLQLMAAWLKATPAPKRWQALQAHISHNVATDAFCWTKSSSLSCKWRAQHTVASAPAVAVR